MGSRDSYDAADRLSSNGRAGHTKIRSAHSAVAYLPCWGPLPVLDYLCPTPRLESLGFALGLEGFSEALAFARLRHWHSEEVGKVEWLVDGGFLSCHPVTPEQEKPALLAGCKGFAALRRFMPASA